MIKNLVLWLVIGLILLLAYNNLGKPPTQIQSIPYSVFVDSAKKNDIKQVLIEGRTVTGSYLNGQGFISYLPYESLPLQVMNILEQNQTQVKAQPPEHQSVLMQIFISWFPMFLIVGIYWFFILRQMQGGGGGRGAMSFGRSRARLLGEDQIKITFADVAGVEEAKSEVSELVEFLRDPTKFQNLGGRIPKGVLMVGQPGTGKTLLAKAIAGEAKVPFFTISGSDFVEMFVGVGASRVRDMFEQAKKHAPCIIFIDEIDAVGRHRGAGLGGGHDEREQTLNQLLVEMDGFEGNEGVIVIAATNRPDVLDPALLRPGRFDRQVSVDLPDIRGREQILKVHMRKVPASDSVDAKVIARGTPGFSGADLANLVNEAALFAARSNKKVVEMGEFERAKDKLLMGVERKTMVMGEQERKLTAYHEAGHAIVGLSVPDHDPVYKISIIPRARALGVTLFLPEGDRYSYSKRRLESQLSSLFGGRIAEELIYGKEYVTTGASNDIHRASEIARNMVTKWGLSEKLGPLTYGEEEGQVFLGHAKNKTKEISDETAKIIDEEIRLIIDKNYQNAKQILIKNMPQLHLMAEALLKYETVDVDQIQDVMNGIPARPPKDWDTDHKTAAIRNSDENSSGGLNNPVGSNSEINKKIDSNDSMGDMTSH
ncbi:MAG: hflB [Francisellaceae bacterium]|nr:hflB [Francisellaceae bacterium]